MKIQSQKRLVAIAFIVSLFFHGVIFVLLLLYRHNVLNQDDKLIDEIIKENDITSKEWAETKTYASHYGAPVIFHDLLDDNDDNNQHNENESSDVDSVLDIIDSVKLEKSSPVLSYKLQDNDSKDSHIQVPHNVKKSFHDSVQQSQNTIIKKQELASSVIKQVAPKVIPTLAQLTQGFLESKDEGGRCSVKMIGNRKGMPTSEQMKYEMYLQKLGVCCQNSFAINQKRLPSYDSSIATVGIYLAINRDGTIKQLHVLKSSGDIHIDHFVLFVIRDASSSFPPVPRYLPDDPFAITYGITITTK